MAQRLWTALLPAGLILVLLSVMSVSLKAPHLIECVFLHRANVTCTWTPGDSQTTHYTLNVQRVEGAVKPWTCSTTNTSCAVEIDGSSVNFNFCISITAHSPHGNVASTPRCQRGTKEIMLHPVILDSIYPVDGKPRCLTLTWHKKPVLFLVSRSQIEGGQLESQIQFNALGESDVTVSNVTVTSYSFVACLFSPDTNYTVRLRHRYRRSSGPWSTWSNTCRGTTGEDAPASAPKFWRQVSKVHRDRDKHRLTSLQWKPLPHASANGRVLFYNVTCRTENTEVWQDKGNCSDLDHSHTSCTLPLPLGRCSCSISASTSVGMSPKAWLWFNKASETEPPSLSQVTVAPLDKSSLRIHWAPPSPSSVSLSGFVVEWFVVRQKNNGPLYWERLNGSSTTTIITEGVEPFRRYSVSVRALYDNQGAGQSRTEYVYTCQGVPSAGPNVQVQMMGSTVNLRWTLPVEHLHGFIHNYTLYYRRTNEPAKRVVLPGDMEQYSLQLSPGHYEFSMQASTKAGAGVTGPSTSVYVGSEEISLLLCVILPIALISLVLGLMVYVSQNKMVRNKLCEHIPDPSSSSLAQWSPKSTMTGMKLTNFDIKYSEVVLLSQREMQNSESDQDSYHQICSPPVTQLGYHTFKCSPDSIHIGAKTPIFTSCSSSYTRILMSDSEPTSPPQQWTDQCCGSPSVNNCQQPPGGVLESCISCITGLNAPLSQDPQTAHPLVLFSPHKATAQLLNFSHFTSVPLLQTHNFIQEAQEQNTPFPCLSYPSSAFMDLSQSSMQCDPYMPV